ncbi:MAG: aspartate--tRNA(Asn) ligase [Oscillospiraceae bacterium]|nr:aspartate--tRNA(Asn) ligase [Oscillospiraceae bacterium]
MEFVAFDKPRACRDIASIIAQVQAGKLANGDAVTVQGSLHRIKEMSGFAFVNVRGARHVFQCIWHDDISQGNIKDYAVEDCVVISGTIVMEERSRLGFDISIVSMEKLSSAAEQLPVEISNDRKIDKLQLDTLLNHRVVTLRNPKVRAAMRIADGVMHAFRTHLRSEGFVEFVPPKLVQAGAEGGAALFEVDFFGDKAYLTQSPQMHKQIMVGAVNKAYCVAPAFRGEKHSTNRHLCEYESLDFEMGFIDSFQDLMAVECRLFTHMLRFLNEEYAPELEMFLGQGNRLPEITQFPQIKFAEAKRLYADAHNKPAQDLADLSPDEEKWLGEYFLKEHNAPIVFITHYPSKKRPFYAMDDANDPRVTLSFDCLMYGQEVTTGGQRIHDYHEQVAKMQARGMDIADFDDYLAMHKYGMPPHGGLALGMERVVQKLLGLDNIRRATAFPRDRDRLRP